MPLINKHHPVLSHASEGIHGMFDYSSDFSVTDKEGDMSDSSTMQRNQSRKAVRMPVVPARARLRVSRMIEDLTLQLRELEATAKYEAEHEKTLKELEDPHDLYLSSEEDGSESADESVEGSSASYVQIDPEHRSVSVSSSNRSSIEDIARSITLAFVGKPQLVEVSSKSLPKKVNPLTTSTPSRTSSLRPVNLSQQSSTTSYIPPRRPSLNTSYSLPAEYSANKRMRGSPLSSLSSITTSISAQHLPRTTSISSVASGHTTSPATSVSPATPASSKTNSSWRSGLGRMVTPRKRPSMSSLSNAFKETIASHPALGRHSSSLGNLSGTASIHEHEAYEVVQTEPVPQPSPVRSETSFERKRRNRLSLNLSLSSLQMSPGFARSSFSDNFGFSMERPSAPEEAINRVADQPPQLPMIPRSSTMGELVRKKSTQTLSGFRGALRRGSGAGLV